MPADLTAIGIIAALGLVFLIIGAKKLPEFAHGLGRSVGMYKKGKIEIEKELNAGAASAATEPR